MTAQDLIDKLIKEEFDRFLDEDRSVGETRE